MEGTMDEYVVLLQCPDFLIMEFLNAYYVSAHNLKFRKTSN